MKSEHSLWRDVQRGETKTLELKERLPKGENLAKTLIAFANTSGGRLVLGVNDKRQVVGIHGDEFDLMDQIASILHSHCQPTLLPNIYLETFEGKTLVVIQVHRGSHLPYFLKAKGREVGTYVRLGATNRQASLEMIHELERQRLQQSFDEQIAWDVSLEELDLTPLLHAFERAGRSLDSSKMRSLKLIRSDQGKDYPTHGLMILLGRYEQVEIKCSRFKGNTMKVFLDKKEYTGDLFHQLEQTEAFIKNHLHLKAEILGLQRTETYEIPISAIREALVNAVVHRDYSNAGRDIKVGVYDDVVNIVSPGGFPNGLILEEALEGRSEIRNRVLARVFKELGYIEQWGSGLSRIRELCLDAGNPKPVIKEVGDFVDIEFYRFFGVAGSENVGETPEGVGENSGNVGETPKVVGENSGDVGETPKVIGESSDQAPTILDLMKQDPEVSARSLAQALGISSRAVERQIAKLKEQGKIKRIGSARGGHWKVMARVFLIQRETKL